MSYKDVPHAAVNELMKWVQKQGKQVVKLHTWPHLAGWSTLPDWSAHIDVSSPQPLHVHIKRKGYKFVIVHEPDDALCPTCCTRLLASLVSHDSLAQQPEPALVAPQV